MASSGTPGAVSKLRDGLFTASLNYVVCVTPEVFVALCCFVAAKKQPPEAARLTNCTVRLPTLHGVVLPFMSALL